MKNQEFLNDEKFKQILKNVSHLTNIREEICEQKRNSEQLYFAKPKSLDEDRLALTEKAKSLLGISIVKDNQNSTFDCASFVAYLFMSELGIDILQNGYGYSTTGKIMSSNNGKCCLIDESKSIKEKIDFVLKNAKIGDVLLFHRQSAKSSFVEENNWFPGHVGFYVGDGKYIDARHRRGDVRLVDMRDDLYMNCFMGIKRFIFEKSLESESFENDKQSCK